MLAACTSEDRQATFLCIAMLVNTVHIKDAQALYQKCEMQGFNAQAAEYLIRHQPQPKLHPYRLSVLLVVKSLNS